MDKRNQIKELEGGGSEEGKNWPGPGQCPEKDMCAGLAARPGRILLLLWRFPTFFQGVDERLP
jgi:hypothetical protein